MKHLTIVVAVTLLLTPMGLGGPYQVAYEGDVFPEQDGWERFISGTGVDRLLDAGIFRMTTDDPWTADTYINYRNGSLDASVGEMFYAEWRMRLLPDSGQADVTVYIGRDNAVGDINIGYSPDHFTSFFDGIQVSIDTTVFRTYRAESYDMQDYDFYIDSEYSYSGFFDSPGIQDSLVHFGDCCIPQASGSEWDYFRFGVVKRSDLNFDGTVNLLDFATFARCFDLPTDSPTTTCSDLELIRSDLDGSGMINLADFASFAKQFGT